jgi:hypothetical protein
MFMEPAIAPLQGLVAIDSVSRSRPASAAPACRPVLFGPQGAGVHGVEECEFDGVLRCRTR